MTALALVPGACTLRAQQGAAIPRLSFTKLLKGSTPEYVSLSIDANGKGIYDSWNPAGSPSPRPIQISAGTTKQIFSLAESLNYFRSLNLESRHKVANMGLKTFTYESGKEINKVEYNYTENRTAQELAATLEKIADVEERIAQLQFAMKYDHLGLPQILREIQGGMDEHAFVEATLMIPVLEKIASDPRLMHLAQARARDIMQRIRESK